MIAIDTNLLVYAHRSSTAEHIRARQALERAARSPLGWGFALPVLSEFWSIVTHPSAVGRPSTPEEAGRFIRALVRTGRARLWKPEDGFPERLMVTAESLKICGVRIFDLQIALMAREGGAREIWTHDSRFVGVPGMRIHDPLN